VILIINPNYALEDLLHPEITSTTAASLYFLI